MEKFRIGDRVMVSPTATIREGFREIFAYVTEIAVYDEDWARITLDQHPLGMKREGWWTPTDELILVEHSPEVGDWGYIIPRDGANHEAIPRLIGLMVEIIAVDEYRCDEGSSDLGVRAIGKRRDVPHMPEFWLPRDRVSIENWHDLE